MRNRIAKLFGITATAALLAGCAHDQVSQYFTNNTVALRSSQEDDAEVVAWLPKGMQVVPDGVVGSHANSTWKVDTPMGTGWVYTRYLTLKLTDIGPI